MFSRMRVVFRRPDPGRISSHRFRRCFLIEQESESKGKFRDVLLDPAATQNIGGCSFMAAHKRRTRTICGRFILNVAIVTCLI